MCGIGEWVENGWNGEVKLIRSHAKIDVKSYFMGDLFSLHIFVCKGENVKFLHFEFMK